VDLTSTPLRKRGTPLPIHIHRLNRALVASNTDNDIANATEDAFNKYSEDDLCPALKILQGLCGVELARASLLLSIAHPDTVPFFSDELYRWAHWNSDGWNQNINLTINKYNSLLGVVKALRARFKLGVTAVEVEKVAYVLARESIIGGNSYEFFTPLPA
jgi:hypothetical protein